MKNKNFHKNGMEVIKEGNGSYKKDQMKKINLKNTITIVKY